jgi:predicted DCC family thiol-disulfide oxidoreductase YuxK
MSAMETNIVLFDGLCNLCSKTVQFIIRNDSKSKFKFASLQSENAQLLLSQLKLLPNSFDSLIYIGDNMFYLKSTAVLTILKKLGGGWQLLYVLIIIPRFLRDMVYDFIAKRRYKCFGKRATCMVPTPEYQERFLD